MQLDEFLIDLGPTDTGDLQKLEIGFATKQTLGGLLGGISGKSWCLSSVEVLHFSSGKREMFQYDDWLNENKRRVQLVPGKVGDTNTYKVQCMVWQGCIVVFRLSHSLRGVAYLNRSRILAMRI